jgi:ATP-dependent helicase/nuclease subunit A
MNNMANFTPEQQQAITTLHCNVSVSAGAGSGKTRVLVERFLHILEDPKADAGRILAITFTRKAAKEMKERVRKAILERVETSSGADKAHWQEQLKASDRAFITTIDSFCSLILRENPVEAGMDPNFEVQEDYETTQFRTDTITAFLNDMVKSGNNDVAELLHLYTPRRLADILFDFVERLPDVLAIQDLAAPYEERLAKKDVLAETCRRALEELLAHINEAGKKTQEKLMAMLEQKEDILTAIDHADFESLGTFTTVRAAGKVSDLIKAWKSSVEDYALLTNDEAAISIARAWQHVFKNLYERLMQEALRQECFSFSFLSGRAVQLLKDNPELCQKYQNRFDAIMVDEFQDTNLQQKELVYLLCGGDANVLKGDKLFVVGDAKQSIYRFRGADVSVFRKVRDDIEKAGGKNIVMADNFRSAPEIITACNTLFRDLLGNDPQADVTSQNLVPHQESTANPVAGLIDTTDLTKQEAAMAQARWTVKKIQKLKTAHPEISYGDVAILVSAIRLADPYAAALAEAGIACNITDGKGFYERQEIVDIINLLECLVNTQQDWAVAGYLRSPYGGVSDNEIMQLREKWPDLTLWEALGQAITEPFVSCYETLTELHIKAKMSSLPELFDDIMERLHMEPLLCAQPHGREKLANVRKLRSMAVTFAMNEGGSVDDFLQKLRIMRSLGARESAANLDEDSQSVNIMTIHKSKGLEFPAVFLPDLQYRGQSDRSGLHFMQSAGLGIKVPGPDGDIVETSLFSEIKEHEKDLEHAEKKRQLYVAMTRAEKYLYVSALTDSSKKKSSGAENWSESLQRVFGRGTQNLVTWEDVSGKELLDAKEQAAKNTGVFTVPDAVFDQTAPIELPREWKLSASALLTYDFCPRRFFYAYDQHMPGEDPDLVSAGTSRIAPSTLGTFVHKALELSLQYPLDDAVKLALEDGEYSAFEKRILKEEGTPLIENYVQSNLYKNVRDLEQEGELGFDLPLLTVGNQNVRFQGSIDKLVFMPDGTLKIIDYKTGQPPASGEAKKGYTRQLVIYALAAEKLYHKPVSAAELHFLRDLSIYVLTNRKTEEEELQALLNHIASCHEEVDYPAKTDTCDHCPFVYFCTEGKM